MSYCPKCGKNGRNNDFLQTPASAPVYPRYGNEKQEKHEKHEKGEKSEKPEKGQGGAVGWLIGGLILVFFYTAAYTNILYNWVPS